MHIVAIILICNYYIKTGLSYFLKMLGPAIGYALASFCLKIYVAPGMTPTITDRDPRWIGAWWLGNLGSLFLN